METHVRITQIRSANRCIVKQIRTLEALGLRRIRHTVVQKKSPALQGMLKVVAHLVRIEEVSA